MTGKWTGGWNPLDGAGDDGAAGDPDDDRFNNLGEYEADTDPQDPRSFLGLLGLEQETGQVLVRWHGGLWATQQLEFCHEIDSGDGRWEVVATLDSPGRVTNTWSGDIMASGSVFYRVRAWRPGS